MKPFTRFIHYVYYKMATRLKSRALEAYAYLISTILSNVSATGMQWLKCKRDNLEELPEMSFSGEQQEEEENGEDEGMSMYGFTSLVILPSESSVRIPVSWIRTERSIRVLQESIKVVLQTL